MGEGRDLFARRKDGSEVAVDISLHPINTAGGMFVLANILDATDRRRATRQRESRQATEHLALMGQLVGGVAHEIRTPLCVIRNDAYYLQTMADQLNQEGVECIQEINEAVGKAERIVNELLDYTREPVASRLAPTCLADLIESAVGDVVIARTIELRLPEVGADLIVEVDREQIERILINLIRNAVQALNNSGIVEIRVGRAAQSVWIEVADNGPGIPASEKEHVFDPLFTTKPSGIGLGLAVSRRYARGNGGSLTVSDNQNRGTCFRLSLPDLQAGDAEEC